MNTTFELDANPVDWSAVDFDADAAQAATDADEDRRVYEAMFRMTGAELKVRADAGDAAALDEIGRRQVRRAAKRERRAVYAAHLASKAGA